MDNHLWQHLYKWARRRHPRKSRRWVTARYFGSFHPTRGNQWVFGDRDSGAYLHYYAWTKIVRHAPVPGRYSPDDPALAQYWTNRRRKRKPPQLAPTWERILRTQHGRCPLCEELLLFTDRPPDSPTQWQTWYQGIRKALAHQAITTQGDSSRTTSRLVHATALVATQTTQRTAPTRNCRCQLALAGGLSRVPRRVARTVLRGRRRSNAPALPDHRLHWVRDVTFDEDRSQVRTGNAHRDNYRLRMLLIGGGLDHSLTPHSSR